MTDSFPAGGRRIVFYLFHDSRGIVEDYVVYKLERLRPFVDEIFVVVNGTVSAEGRERLEAVAETVWERDNVGFDVWGYKTALEQVGQERLAEFDELILMNYTWYGPVGEFGPVFEQMSAEPLDFWGITAHASMTPNPYTRRGVMPEHIQSHWIAIRRPMFTSPEWAEYWQTMPMIRSYEESILRHESRFTDHFRRLGFTAEVAFPLENYPAAHPAFDNAQMLLEDGCPVLKRRPFLHWPLYLDRNAIIGRWLLDTAEARGYPVSMILADMAKRAQPKVLNTNASMLEILPEVDVSYDASRPFRIAAIVHIFYEEMTEELLEHLSNIPSEFDLYVTTTDEEKAATIEEIIVRSQTPGLRKHEVRILSSNRGRDLSGFFIACRDVIRGGDYDLVVKVHSKKTVQRQAGIGNFFKRQQLDNLLNSPGYTANLIALFQKEPGLGVVFPPTIHIGFPTLGGAWFLNREPAQELADSVGIRVPFDSPSPLGPLGAMWVARPEALRLLTDVEWTYDDYSAETDHRDGSLAHVQERIVSYAAGELGYHSRTVANAEYAAISHTFLEFKLDQISATLPGYAIDQVHFLRKRRLFYSPDSLGYIKAYLMRHHPRFAVVLLAFYRPTRGLYRRALRRGPKPD